MLAKRFLIGAVVTGLLGTASAVFAQSDESKPKTDEGKPKTIVQRLDSFGKTIFGGIFPSDKSKANPNPKPSTLTSPQIHDRPLPRRSAAPDITDDEPITSRSAATTTKPDRGSALAESPPPDVTGLTPENAPLTVRRQVRETPRPEITKRETPRPRMTRPETETPGTTKAVAAGAENPPMHERFLHFRESAFDADGANTPMPRTDTGAPQPSTPMPRANTRSLQPDTLVPQPSTPSNVMPEQTTTVAPAEKLEKLGRSESEDSAPNSIYPPESRPIVAQRAATPLVPQRAAPAVRPAQPISEPAGGSSGVGSVVVESRPSAPQGLRPAGRAGADEVLIARKGPILSVDTTGPRTIAVGRESTYHVNLKNSGDVAADDLTLHVTLPDWTEVLGLNVTAGDAPMPETTRGGAIIWKVGHVDAKSQQRLTIRLVPRQNRPFDLAVRWEFKPITTQTMIEVQEPRLVLKIEGPREVQYGKKEIYRLKLSNTGNGNAENVVLVLTPVGTGDNMPASHKVGLLAAGEEKSLDVEVTARQSGALTIQAEAHGDNNVRTDIEEKILVHRAVLKLDIEGPRVQFVGSVANYTVRVRNTGSAPARNVHFTILLPNGAKYISGVDGIRRSASQNKLEWLLETLAPDVEQNFTLRCALGTPGLGKARVYLVAEDDLMTSAETIVQIDSVANLTMEVRDPTGPVPVGEEAVYELRVRNRGTREAENIEVFAYFSRGIEPIGAEGAPNRLGPGQVVFQPLSSLAPGAETVLKIRARAEAAGNHVFRAEARCKTLNARLVSEATNLYYTDGPTETQPPQTAAAAPSVNPPVNQAPPVNEAMRIIPRPGADNQNQTPPVSEAMRVIPRPSANNQNPTSLLPRR
jgi:uncharacterized repeat protein (TIGR01451 family)